MILFMPWPVQKYITTHLYIIAEFVERGKWGRRCLLLHFALAPPPHALRVIPELLRTSLALCALFQYCFALLSRFARYSSIASHFSRALRVIPVLLRTSLALCALFQYCSALRAPAILRGIHTPACRPSCSCRVILSNALHAASKLSHVRA